MAFKRNDGWKQSLFESTGRLGILLLIIFVLLILQCFPLRIGGFGEIRPAFLLMAVYYWAIYRPYMLGVVGAFVAGLALDLLTGVPLGLNALTLVAVRTLAASQQKFMLAQKFGVMWLCFALVAFGAGLLQWLVVTVLLLEATALQPVMFSALLTTLLFPALALPLYLINRAIDDRQIFS